MIAPEDRCAAWTIRATRCRNRGKWTVPGVAGGLCKPHAIKAATAPNGDYLIFYADTGRSFEVSPPARTPRADNRPLPSGLDAIVTALDKATTEPAFARCRRAILAQIVDLKDERQGLKPELLTALHAARDRLRPPSRSHLRTGGSR